MEEEFALSFVKMSGHGNHFIILDNRASWIKDRQGFTTYFSRHENVGADGVIFLERSEKAEFKMSYFNRDGSEARMCGNGARCLSHYANHTQGYGAQGRMETLAGTIDYDVKGKRVKVSLPLGAPTVQARSIDGKKVSFLDTGVPHAVLHIKERREFENWDALGEGRKIRNHENFGPSGTNVNVYYVEDGVLFIRTYERGVEDETLACGTGAVACSIVAAREGSLSFPLPVIPKSQEELMIHKKDEEGKAVYYLEGDVKLIYEGTFVTEDTKKFLQTILSHV